ncbi:response regulator transcription factor [Clostridium sp. 'deep sea']|uniref:LytR/AlgR family response regulator transcription factor n=1 Tax=Clostridium sp. 'deep sea' TaxID=2779445 RepID=UPI0018967801|nr:LytTR family DNA-binding domain-containing protein [Clostridium sp. 'deep sea']QOR34933.1 response regulator transcription factor [Clostridium sp. 'deep sea']
MIHIAICDDSIADIEIIEKYLKKLELSFKVSFKISVFYSGIKFCDALNNNCYFDIVLMDIEMDNIDGIRAGYCLRSFEDNDFVHLLYISNHETFFRELLELQPTGFINKPLNEQVFNKKLCSVISRVIKRKNSGKSKMLSISLKARELLIPFNEIIYFESKVRTINLVTTTNKISYYGKLKDQLSKLPTTDFIRTHQSYIINFSYVRAIEKNQITLTNNNLIPISNKYSNDVKKKYFEFRRNYFV